MKKLLSLSLMWLKNLFGQRSKLLAEQERLSWLLAGVSTAVLGYVKPDDTYAGRPIDQIEEAVRLRAAFEMACESLKPFFSVSGGKALATNDLMCEFLRRAEQRIAQIRIAYVPTGRTQIRPKIKENHA